MNQWQEFPDGFYVYEIAVDGIVRYVGCGKNGRVFDHLRAQSTASSGRLRQAHLDGCRLQYRFVGEGLSKKAALKLELERISLYDQLWNAAPPDPMRMTKARWSRPGADKRQSKAMRSKWCEPGYRAARSESAKAAWYRRKTELHV